jgi:hypothetical protein
MSTPQLAHVRAVHIGGEIFQVRSDAPPEMIEELAGFIEDGLKRAQAVLGEQDRFRAAVLSSLHVAGELWETRAERDAARAELENLRRRLTSLADLLPAED